MKLCRNNWPRRNAKKKKNKTNAESIEKAQQGCGVLPGGAPPHPHRIPSPAPPKPDAEIQNPKHRQPLKIKKKKLNGLRPTTSREEKVNNRKKPDRRVSHPKKKKKSRPKKKLKKSKPERAAVCGSSRHLSHRLWQAEARLSCVLRNDEEWFPPTLCVCVCVCKVVERGSLSSSPDRRRRRRRRCSRRRRVPPPPHTAYPYSTRRPTRTANRASHARQTESDIENTIGSRQSRLYGFYIRARRERAGLLLLVQFLPSPRVPARPRFCFRFFSQHGPLVTTTTTTTTITPRSLLLLCLWLVVVIVRRTNVFAAQKI